MHRSRHARLAPAVLTAVVVIVGACATSAVVPSPSSSPSASPAALVSPTPSAASATPSATPAPTDDGSSPYDAKVDVGAGRRIHVLCRGERRPGVPTVLLEHGLDGSLHNWAAVNQPLQALTRVCGTDRAGLGDSDPPPPGERTVDDLVDDLEAAMAAAGVEGPFVLVAHSMGPWVSTVFTARRPDDVAGLVLVDPRGPRVTAEHEAALPPPAAGEAQVLTDVRAFFADGGFDGNTEHVPFAPSEAIVAGLLEADGPFFGDRPVVVLGAERTIDQLPPLPEPDLKAWWRIWQDGQRAYADESTRGSFSEVAGSGHLMMDDRPRAVIDAVRDVLDRTRTP